MFAMLAATVLTTLAGPVGGAQAQTAPLGATASSDAAVAATAYRLTVRHSGKCLTRPGGTWGDAVVQWDCLDRYSLGQQWRMEDTDSSYFLLVNVRDGQCLDIEAASTKDGGDAHMWPCHGQAHQQFKLVLVQPGYYQIVARHSGKCLEVDNRSMYNGAQVQQFACSKAEHRQWNFS
jgi:hypothetical protein